MITDLQNSVHSHNLGETGYFPALAFILRADHFFGLSVQDDPGLRGD